MSKIASIVIIMAFSCAVVNANYVQNGNLEAWTAGVPDNWFYAVPAGTDIVTQVTGLDGTGSAAKLGSGDLKNNIAAIGAGESFFFQFDFSYETGTGRTVNAVLRQISLGDDRGINVKVEGGSLYCYSSATGWVAVTGATGLAANNAYRVTIEGDWEGDYEVSLDDLTGSSNIVSGVSMTAWQNVSGPGITDSVNMNRSNTTVDWTFDNVVVEDWDPVRPYIGSMPMQTVYSGSPVTTAPVVTDGDTPEANLTYFWTQVSGPSISFSTNPGETENDKNAVVTFSSRGSYELELTVTDPESHVHDRTFLYRVKDAGDDVLLGRWDFEEADDPNVVLDTTGYAGNDLADNGIINAATIPHAEGWVNSQALDLSGPSTPIVTISENVNTDPNMSMSTLAWEFSVSAWVKADPDNIVPYNSIISREEPFIWSLRQKNDGRAQFIIALENGNNAGIYGANILDDYWHHITGTFNGSELALYVDGILSNSVAVSSLMKVDPTAQVTIGNRIFSDYPWNGLLDDVRVYSYALPYDDGEHSVIGLASSGINAIPSVDIDEDNADTHGTTAGDPLMYTTSSASTNLYADIIDPDGNIAGQLWTVISEPAPGDVSFGDASSANTSVSFRQAGTYILQLEVWDDYGAGAESDIYDRITIYVEAPSCEDLLLTAQNGVVSNPYLAADISGPLGMPDCSVDLYDIAAMSREWLKCVDPKDANCVNPFE